VSHPETEITDVNDGDTVWISPDPAMPLIQAIFEAPIGSIGPVEWHMESKYAKRKGLDDKSSSMVLPLDQPWLLPVDAFFGGDVTLSATIDGYTTQTTLFHIRGQNPEPSFAKQFIIDHAGAHRFAWAIVQHESRRGIRIYNQFLSSVNRSGEPVFGPPDGWGMCQIDSARGSPVETDEVWDWKTNVLSGIEVMDESREKAQAYFDFLREKFLPEGIWEEPPNDFVGPGTVTHMSALEAAEILLYNGGAIPARIWVEDGEIIAQGVAGRRGQLPAHPNAIHLDSCFAFDPDAPPGVKWKFYDNRNRYFYKVIHDEFEASGAMSSQ
jgi:hypothetical protein